MAHVEEPQGFRLPIHQSLVRPRLLMGGERTLVVLSAAIAVLPLASGDVRLIAVGALFWLGCIPLLRLAAKLDPQLSDVLPRHFNHKAYTAAQPSIIAGPPPPKINQ